MLEEAFSTDYLLAASLLMLALMFLGHCCFATAEGLRRERRWAIVAMFAISAVFTPPDPISQVLLALLMIVVYEASICFLDQR